MELKSPIEKGTILGLLLVGIGALFLLQNLGIVAGVGRFAVALGFLGGAAIFLLIGLRDHRQWWAFFPAFGLGFVGLQISIPGWGGGGSLFLGGLGLVFAAIYAVQRTHYWPIIPAGVLLTLCVVSGLDAWFPALSTGWLFFAGLAVTFGTVYYVDRQGAGWAAIVAVVTGLLGLLDLVGSLMKYLFPVALVLGGLYLLMRPQQRPPHDPE